MIDLALKLLPPQEAIDYFRAKGFKIGFDYRDVWQQEHQHAFTVAKAMELDLLADIRAAVDAALAEGTTLKTFIDTLRPNLARRGWWGTQQVVDPKTNQKVLAQLGSPRRLKVIYDTNLRTAHAEGQWQRIQTVKKALPYLMYDHTPSPYERPEHVAWDGLVLPVDDPWWQRHLPVKAWGCKCRVIQLGERQLKRLGKSVDEAPAEEWREYTNKRTGETQSVPAGVDPAFHYPPLSRKQALQEMLEAKQQKSSEALALPDLPPGRTPVPPYRQAQTIAEAQRIGSELLSAQNEHAYPTHFGGPLTRFSHTGVPWRGGEDYAQRVAAKFFGQADYRGLDLDTANFLNRELATLQEACDAMGIPRLRGMAVQDSNSSRASMGDGVLRVNRATFRVSRISPWEPSSWTRSSPAGERPGGASFFFGTAHEMARCTLWHEFGHHVHQTAGVKGSALAYKAPPLEQAMRGPIAQAKATLEGRAPTGYADTDPLECFAECYALLEMGRADLLPAYMLDMITQVKKGELP